MTREEIMLSLGMDASQAKAALNSFSSTVKGWATQTSNDVRGAFAAAGLFSIFNSITNKIDTIKRISAVGFSDSMVQDFLNVGKAAGLSEGAIESMLDKFAKGLAPGEDPDTALREFADKLAGVEDPGERARMAIDAFGKTGVKLIGILEEGGKGLSNFSNEFSKFSDKELKSIDQADRAWDKALHTAQIIAGKIIGAQFDGLQRVGRLAKDTGLENAAARKDSISDAAMHEIALIDKTGKIREDQSLKEAYEAEKRIKKEAELQEFWSKINMDRAKKDMAERDRKNAELNRNEQTRIKDLAVLTRSLHAARSAEFLPTLQELAGSGTFFRGRPMVGRSFFQQGPFAADAQRLLFLQEDAKQAAIFGNTGRRQSNLKEIQSIRDRLTAAGVFEDPNSALIKRIDELQTEGMPVTVRLPE